MSPLTLLHPLSLLPLFSPPIARAGRFPAPPPIARAGRFPAPPSIARAGRFPAKYISVNNLKNHHL